MRERFYYLICGLLLAGCAQTAYSAAETEQAPEPPAEQVQQAPTPTPSKLAVFPASSRSGGTQYAELACGLVTVADLTEVLGPANYASLPQGEFVERQGFIYTCTYSAGGDPINSPLFTTFSKVDVTADVAAGWYADSRDRQEEPILDVFGVGEQAYWVNLGTGLPASLYARKANVGLLMDFSGPVGVEQQAAYEEIMRRALAGQLNAVIPPTPTPVPFLLTPEIVPLQSGEGPDACAIIDPRSVEYTLNYAESGLNLLTEKFALDEEGNAGGCHLYYAHPDGFAATSFIMTYRISSSRPGVPFGEKTLIPLLDDAVWTDASTLHIARGNVYFVFEVPRLLEAPYLQPNIEQTGADLARVFTYEYGAFEHTP